MTTTPQPATRSAAVAPLAAPTPSTPTRECETVARRRGAQADYVANLGRRAVR